MDKKMSFIKLLSIFLIMIFTSLISANTSDPEVNSEITLEEATEDLSQRMLFSLLGKEVFMLVNNTDDKILEGAVDEKRISAPFPYVGNEFVLILTSITLLSLLLAIGYSVFLLYEAMNKSQKSGDFLGKNWNGAFLIIKAIIVFILLFPVSIGSGYISLSQMIPLKVFSTSNKYASDIIVEFVKTQPKIYPEIKYPEVSTNLKYIAINSVQFFNCLKANSESNYDKKISKSDDNVLFGYFGKKSDCSFVVRFSLDKDSEERINNNSKLNDFFKSNYSLSSFYFNKEEFYGYDYYVSNLIDSYDLLMKEIMNISARTSEIILRKNIAENINSIEKYKENSQLKEFFQENRVDLFENKCENFFNKEMRSEVSFFDRLFYLEYASSCMSYMITKSIAYPHNNENILNYFNGENYLRFNNLSLCSHNYSNTDLKIPFVEENNNFNNIKNIPLEECMVNQCSNLNSINSNVYNCSSAVKFYSIQAVDEKIAKLGFFALGGIIQNSFNVYDNQSSKQLLNNIKISNVSNFNNTENIIPVEKIETKSFVSLNDNNNIRIFYNFFEEININSFFKTMSFADVRMPDLKENKQIIDAGNFPLSDLIIPSDSNVKEANINFLLDRLTTCSTSPLQIKSGYVCGNIVQEYNKFGRELIKFYVYVQTAKAIISVINRPSKQKFDPNKKATDISSDGLSLSEKVSPTRLLQRYTLNSFLALTLNSSSVINPEKLIENPENYLDLDNFSTVNNKYITNIINDFQVNEVSYGLMAFVVVYLKVDQNKFPALFSVLSTILTAILLFGILFAILIPIIPFWLFIVVSVNLISLILSKVFIMPFLTIFLMEPSKSHNSETLKMYFSSLISLLFKVPMIVIGVILSWVITNSIISNLLKMINVDDLFNLSYSSTTLFGFFSTLVFIISLFMYAILFFILTNATFNIIESFDEFADNWMSGKPTNFNTTNDKSAVLMRNFKDYYKSVNK